MRVNLITYNSAITALSKASKMNAKSPAKTNTRSQMHSQSASPTDSGDGHVDTNQLWIRALDLIEQIKSDGMEPDGFSYSAAISCCGAGGRWKEALDLINTMKKGGPKTRPNKIAYTAAICKYEGLIIRFLPLNRSHSFPSILFISGLRKIRRIQRSSRTVYRHEERGLTT